MCNTNESYMMELNKASRQTKRVNKSKEKLSNITMNELNQSNKTANSLEYVVIFISEGERDFSVAKAVCKQELHVDELLATAILSTEHTFIMYQIQG